MLAIQALRATVAKKKPVDSSLLPLSQKHSFKEGWICPIEEIIQFTANNHVQVKLGYQAGTWFFYCPHVSLIGYEPETPVNENNLARRLVEVCRDRNYPLKRKSGYLNLIAVEGMLPDGTKTSDQPDKWNDSLFLLEFKDNVPRIVFQALCTTEPGSFYTVNPLSPKGSARLDTGFHKSLWQVGYHRGYVALVQGGNVARLVRDRNRNYLRDDEISYETYRGINLHTTKTTNWQGSANEGSIGRWSAGCVVIYNPDHFKKMMDLIMSSQEYYKNNQVKFDFTLLWRDWLDVKPVKSEEIPFDVDDLDILTRTIYGEARGESQQGQIAVGWVIRNRYEVKDILGFPDNIEAICKQPYQFSCWNKNDPNRIQAMKLNIRSPEYKAFQEIALGVLRGEIADITNRADHYYADYIDPPSWADENYLVAEIGTHLFFSLATKKVSQG